MLPRSPSWILGVQFLREGEKERWNGKREEGEGRDGKGGEGREWEAGKRVIDGMEGNERGRPLDLVPRKNFLATPLPDRLVSESDSERQRVRPRVERERARFFS